MDSASWSAFVLTNHKQDALDARQPTAGSLGLTFYPLRQIIKFALGNSSNSGLVNDPVFNAFGPSANAATSTDELKDNNDSGQQIRRRTAFFNIPASTAAV